MNEDAVIKKLIDIESKLDTLATNERVDRLEENMLSILDKQSVILTRLDQERTFTLDRVKELEADVKKIKLQLAIA